MRHGINPVSIRGTEMRGQPAALALSRIHIGVGGAVKKLMTGTVYIDREPKPGESPDELVLGMVRFDEETFVGGLMHLFPRGEVDAITTSPAPTHADAYRLLQQARNTVNDPVLLAEIDRFLQQYAP